MMDARGGAIAIVTADWSALERVEPEWYWALAVVLGLGALIFLHAISILQDWDKTERDNTVFPPMDDSGDGDGGYGGGD